MELGVPYTITTSTFGISIPLKIHHKTNNLDITFTQLTIPKAMVATKHLIEDDTGRKF